MSRRKGDFQLRTSVFEAAYRAWSHLGGLDPEVLETTSAKDLDPVKFPIQNDTRRHKKRKADKTTKTNNNNNNNQEQQDDQSQQQQQPRRREYPYEALPRSGLDHPFVQEIFNEWLGQDYNNNNNNNSTESAETIIQTHLSTLKNWWQHRKNGESLTAMTALDTTPLLQRMVDGYTRNFFALIQCMVIEDGYEGPKTLQGKMKELAKQRRLEKRQKKQEEKAMKEQQQEVLREQQQQKEKEIHDGDNEKGEGSKKRDREEQEQQSERDGDSEEQRQQQRQQDIKNVNEKESSASSSLLKERKDHKTKKDKDKKEEEDEASLLLQRQIQEKRRKVESLLLTVPAKGEWL